MPRVTLNASILKSSQQPELQRDLRGPQAVRVHAHSGAAAALEVSQSLQTRAMAGALAPRPSHAQDAPPMPGARFQADLRRRLESIPVRKMDKARELPARPLDAELIEPRQALKNLSEPDFAGVEEAFEALQHALIGFDGAATYEVAQVRYLCALEHLKTACNEAKRSLFGRCDVEVRVQALHQLGNIIQCASRLLWEQKFEPGEAQPPSRLEFPPDALPEDAKKGPQAFTAQDLHIITRLAPRCCAYAPASRTWDVNLRDLVIALQESGVNMRDPRRVALLLFAMAAALSAPIGHLELPEQDSSESLGRLITRAAELSFSSLGITIPEPVPGFNPCASLEEDHPDHPFDGYAVDLRPLIQVNRPQPNAWFTLKLHGGCEERLGLRFPPSMRFHIESSQPRENVCMALREHRMKEYGRTFQEAFFPAPPNAAAGIR